VRPSTVTRLRSHPATSSHHIFKPFHLFHTPQLPHFHKRTLTMAPSATEKSQAKSSGHKAEDVDGSHNEWKFRAPYKVHENEDGFKALYEASCHCGKVKYQLSREEPLDAKYCHCTTCQVLHGSSPLLPASHKMRTSWRRPNRLTINSGAPFQWAAIFHKEDINFTHGHHELGWYDSGDKTTRHKLPCKVSCAYCRTPIMDEGRNMILLFPTLIKWRNEAERKKFAPS
jgi:hypothetical protein